MSIHYPGPFIIMQALRRALRLPLQPRRVLPGSAFPSDRSMYYPGTNLCPFMHADRSIHYHDNNLCPCIVLILPHAGSPPRSPPRPPAASRPAESAFPVHFLSWVLFTSVYVRGTRRSVHLCWWYAQISPSIIMVQIFVHLLSWSIYFPGTISCKLSAALSALPSSCVRSCRVSTY